MIFLYAYLCIGIFIASLGYLAGGDTLNHNKRTTVTVYLSFSVLWPAILIAVLLRFGESE